MNAQRVAGLTALISGAILVIGILMQDSPVRRRSGTRARGRWAQGSWAEARWDPA